MPSPFQQARRPYNQQSRRYQSPNDTTSSGLGPAARAERERNLGLASTASQGRNSDPETNSDEPSKSEIIAPSRVTHFRGADGQLIRIKSPSGDPYLIKQPGRNHPVDPKTGDPVVISEDGATKSIYDGAPITKSNGVLYSTPPGYPKREVGKDPDYIPNATTTSEQKAQDAKAKKDLKEADQIIKDNLERVKNTVSQIDADNELKSIATKRDEAIAKAAELEASKAVTEASAKLKTVESQKDKGDIDQNVVDAASADLEAAKQQAKKLATNTQAITARGIDEDFKRATQKVVMGQNLEQVKLMTTGRRAALTMPSSANTPQNTTTPPPAPSRPVSALPETNPVKQSEAIATSPDIKVIAQPEVGIKSPFAHVSAKEATPGSVFDTPPLPELNLPTRKEFKPGQLKPDFKHAIKSTTNTHFIEDSSEPEVEDWLGMREQGESKGARRTPSQKAADEATPATWLAPEAVAARAAAKTTGADLIHTDDNIQVELPKVGEYDKNGGVIVDGAKVGIVKHNDLGLPEIELSQKVGGMAGSPSYRSQNPFGGVPEYAAPSAQHIEQVTAQAEANDYNPDQQIEQEWKSQRMAEDEFATLVENWRGSGEYERRKMMDAGVLKEMDKEMPDARLLYKQGVISLQQARTLDQAVYGRNPILPTPESSYEAWKQGDTEAAKRLREYESAPASDVTDRQLVSARDELFTEWRNEYRSRHQDQPDFDAATFNASAEKISGGQSTLAERFWSGAEEAGSSVVGSMLGMAATVGATGRTVGFILNQAAEDAGLFEEGRVKDEFLGPPLDRAVVDAAKAKQLSGQKLSKEDLMTLWQAEFADGRQATPAALQAVFTPQTIELTVETGIQQAKNLFSGLWMGRDSDPRKKIITGPIAQVLATGGGFGGGGMRGFQSEDEKKAAVDKYMSERMLPSSPVGYTVDALIDAIDDESLTKGTIDQFAELLKAKAGSMHKITGGEDKSFAEIKKLNPQLTDEEIKKHISDKNNNKLYHYDIRNNKSQVAQLMVAYHETRDPAIAQLLREAFYQTPEGQDNVQKAARYASVNNTIKNSDSWAVLNMSARGIQVNPGELATELVGDVVGYSLLKGLTSSQIVLRAAGKSARVAKSIGRASNSANKFIDSVKKGMDELSQLAKTAGTKPGSPIMNATVQAGKGLAVGTFTEGSEGAMSSMMNEARSAEKIWEDAKQEAYGGAFASIMGGSMAIVSGIADAAKQNEARRKGELGFMKFWNKHNPETPIEQSDVRGILGFISPEEHNTLDKAIDEKAKAFWSEVSAGAPNPATEKAFTEAIYARQRVIDLAVQAHNELGGVGDAKMRDFIKASMKVLTGQPLSQSDQVALEATNAAGDPLVTKSGSEVTWTKEGLSEVTQAAPGLRATYFPASVEQQETDHATRKAQAEAQAKADAEAKEKQDSAPDQTGTEATNPNGETGNSSDGKSEGDGSIPSSGSTVDKAAHDAATSPLNDKAQPTQAQKEAGNYPVGKVNVAGIKISIENPAGSERSGTSKGGKKWTTKMLAHYGYLRGTVGADGDQVDTFVKEGTPENWDGDAFVIPQYVDGKFDEHKIMIGYSSVEEAKKAYKAHYEKGWTGYRPATKVSMAKLAEMIKNGSLKKTNKRTRTNTNEQTTTPATGDTSGTGQTDSNAQPGSDVGPEGVTGELSTDSGVTGDQSPNPRGAGDARREGQETDEGISKEMVREKGEESSWTVRTTKGRTLTIPGDQAKDQQEATNKLAQQTERGELLLIGTLAKNEAEASNKTVTQQVYDVLADMVRGKSKEDAKHIISLGTLIATAIKKHMPSLEAGFSKIVVMSNEVEFGGMYVKGDTLYIAPRTFVKSLTALPAKDMIEFVDRGFFHEYLHAVINSVVTFPEAAKFWNGLTQQARDDFMAAYSQGATNKLKNDGAWGHEYLRAFLENKHGKGISEELFLNTSAFKHATNLIKRIIERLTNIMSSISETADKEWMAEKLSQVSAAFVEAQQNITSGNVDAARNAKASKAKAKPIGSSSMAKAHVNDNFGALLKDAGIGLVPNLTSVSAHYVVSEGGKKRGGYIEYNPMIMAEWSPGQITDAMREELIHALEDKALLAEMMKKGHKMTDAYIQSGQYHIDFYTGIHDMMTPEQIKYVKGIYTSHGNRKYVIGSEFRRMVMQKEHYKGITEQAMAGNKTPAKANAALQAIASLFSSAIASLKKMMFKNTESGRQAKKVYDMAIADLRRIDPRGEAVPLGMAAPASRESVTAGKDLTGDGRSFAKFFSSVTMGSEDKYKPKGNYRPAIELDPSSKAFQVVRYKFRGNFDDHIATSIPGFDEVQAVVGSAIVKTYGDTGADMLDIGASEGALNKAITGLSKGKIKTLAIDPNTSMEKTFKDKGNVTGADFDLSAFGSKEDAGKTAWTEDDGTDIKFFNPKGRKFDVVHEAMVFQFISNARNAQVMRVKELMKPDGIAIFEQKFGDKKDIFDANENKKDLDWKSRHYTVEQLEQKRQDVLNSGGDQVEGMTALQVAHWEMEDVLKSNFKHVTQFWSSGNFRGYVASDSASASSNFLSNLQNTDSEFATQGTPRVVQPMAAPSAGITNKDDARIVEEAVAEWKSRNEKSNNARSMYKDARKRWQDALSAARPWYNKENSDERTKILDEVDAARSEMDSLEDDMQSGHEPIKGVYLRFGKPPEGGRSTNGYTGRKEKGVSVYNVRIADGRWSIVDDGSGGATQESIIDDANRSILLVTGDEVDQGSDEEPVLTNVRVLKELNPNEIVPANWDAESWDEQHSRGWSNQYMAAPSGPTSDPASLKDFDTVEGIKDIINKPGWAILTAENPNKKRESDLRNAILNRGLMKDLQSDTLDYRQVDGHYGYAEKPFIVIDQGMSVAKAAALARKYGQESVLTTEGLVYPDGSYNPAQNVSIFDKKPGDNYTIVKTPTGNVIFSVNMDWDNKIQPMAAPSSQTAPALAEIDRVLDLKKNMPSVITSRLEGGKVRTIAKIYRKLIKTSIRPGGNVNNAGDRMLEVLNRASFEFPNFASWYESRLKMAMDIFTQLDPDLVKPDNRAALLITLAVSSNGADVNTQTVDAWEVYKHWKKSGKLEGANKRGSTRAEAVEEHLALADKMAEHLGGFSNLGDFLNRTGTVKELRNELRKMHLWNKKEILGITTGELIDEIVPFSLIFGPKLGSFFNNMSGDFSTITMDRWFMRTLGRMMGTQLVRVDKSTLTKAWGRLESALAEYDGDLFTNAEIPQKADLLTVETLGKYFQKKVNRENLSPKDDAIRLAVNGLFKIADGFTLVEAPANGSHRRWIRKVMINAIEKYNLTAKIPLVPAEAQALLWYYEKIVHQQHGSRQKDDAPDYGSAANRLHIAERGLPSSLYEDSDGIKPRSGGGRSAAFGGNQSVGTSQGSGDGTSRGDVVQPMAAPSPTNIVEPGFYSHLQNVIAAQLPDTLSTKPGKTIKGRPIAERTITGKDGKVLKVIRAGQEPDKVYPDQTVADQVREIMQKADVTNEEIKWSGIIPWLFTKKSVTKEEVMDYLKSEGTTRFSETSLSNPKPRSLHDLMDIIHEEMIKDDGLGYDHYYDNLSEIRNAVDVWMENRDNKQDIARVEKLTEVPIEKLEEPFKGEPKYNKPGLTTPGGKNYREIILTTPVTTEGAPSYTSHHFDKIPNYIAHMRLQDFDNGVLIDEVQSDREKETRKKGVFEEQVAADKRRIEIENKGQAATPEEKKEWSDIMSKNNGRLNGIPDAPFRRSTQWSLQLFKRALRDAVRDGKEWIGWTTGDTQNDRSGAVKHIAEVRLKKAFGEEDGRLHIEAFNSNNVRIIDSIIQPKELSGKVGNEIAERLNGMEWTTAKREQQNGSIASETFKNIRDLDVTIGGKGMWDLYDKILPAEVGEYVKQWGAKVEMGEIKPQAVLPPVKTVKTWKVQITPEMRDSIKDEGQPLFMAGPRHESPESASEFLERMMAELPPDAEIEALREMAMAESAGSRTVGDPDKANISKNEKIRTEYETMKQIRSGDVSPEKMEDWLETGRKMARNEDDVMNQVMSNYFEGGGLDSPELVFASAIVTARKFRRALQSRDPALIREAMAMAYADGAGRSQTARAMRAMADPHKSPHERNMEYIAKLVTTPSIKERIAIAAAPSPFAKQKLIAKLKAKLEEVKNLLAESEKAGVRGKTHTNLINQHKALSEEVSKAIDEKDRKTLIEEYTESRHNAVMAALAREGVSEEDIFVTPEERVNAQDAEPVREAMEMHPKEHQDAIRYIMRGYSHADVAVMTGLARDVISNIHQDFRQKSLRGTVAKWVKRGNSLFDTIQNGIKYVMGQSMAAPMLYNAAKQAGLMNNEAEIERQLNVLCPTAKQSNSGKMIAEIVNGKNGQQVTIKVPYSPTDFRAVYRVARAISTAQASAYDKMYEFWIMNLLSGPETNVVNVIGNVLSSGLHILAQRPLETLWNIIFRDPNSAQLGEWVHIMRGILPGIRDAFAMAALAFDSEADPVGHRYMNEPLEMTFDSNGQLDKVGAYRGPSIVGKKGRVIRIPGRSLMMVDSFMKALMGNIEVGAQAYRLGKQAQKMGLIGGSTTDIENFIKAEVATPGSKSWELAIDVATELAFQSDTWFSAVARVFAQPKMNYAKYQKKALDAAAEGNVKKMHDMRRAANVLMFVEHAMRFIFPFVRTPTNILTMGIRKSPIGSVSLAGHVLTSIAKGSFNWVKGKPYWAKQDRATIVSLMAEQTQAWLTVATIFQMTEGDDDDDTKKILLVGGRPSGTTSPGSRNEAYRNYGGTYLIIYRDQNGKEIRLPFGRYDPIATVLGTTIDSIIEIKRMHKMKSLGLDGGSAANALTNIIGSLMSQTEDKSFFQGYSNIVKTIDSLRRAGDAPLDLARGFLKQIISGVVPNLIRQPIRNADPLVRDSKDKADLLYSALPLGAFAGPVIDYYGRETEKGGTSLSRILFRAANKQYEREPAEKWITEWNNLHPDDKFQPIDMRSNDYWVYGPSGERRMIVDNKVKTTFEKEVGKEILRLHNNYVSGLTKTSSGKIVSSSDKDVDLKNKLTNLAKDAKTAVRKRFLKSPFESARNAIK